MPSFVVPDPQNTFGISLGGMASGLGNPVTATTRAGTSVPSNTCLPYPTITSLTSRFQFQNVGSDAVRVSSGPVVRPGLSGSQHHLESNSATLPVITSVTSGLQNRQTSNVPIITNVTSGLQINFESSTASMPVITSVTSGLQPVITSVTSGLQNNRVLNISTVPIITDVTSGLQINLESNTLPIITSVTSGLQNRQTSTVPIITNVTSGLQNTSVPTPYGMPVITNVASCPHGNDATNDVPSSLPVITNVASGPIAETLMIAFSEQQPSANSMAQVKSNINLEYSGDLYTGHLNTVNIKIPET